MALVYRARDRNLDCDVVIKVPRRSMLDDPEFAGRFTREIRSLVRLAHPHIVKILDVGEQEGIPFAVLQYFAGGSLRDRQAATDGGRAPLPPEHLAGWLEDVAGALDFIHGQHFIHRDVKPDNILFDEPGNAYLSDFGVAKVINDSRDRKTQTVYTGTGLILGTPQYMAPELLLGRPYDGRVDQYALAVSVFELLSGRYPYDAPTPAALCMLQSTQPPPWLGEVTPTVSRGLSQAVQRALAMNPAERYPNCLAFAQDVRGQIAGACEDLIRAIPSVGDAKGAGKQLACPSCRKPLALPPGTEGRRIWCPWCEKVFRFKGKTSTTPVARPTPTSRFGAGGKETWKAGQQETPSGLRAAEERWLAQPSAARPPSPLPSRKEEQADLAEQEILRLRRHAASRRPSWLVPAIAAGAMLLTTLILAAVALWNRTPEKGAGQEALAEVRSVASQPARVATPEEALQPAAPSAPANERSQPQPRPAPGTPDQAPNAGAPGDTPAQNRFVYTLLVDPPDANLTLQGPGRIEGSGGRRQLVLEGPVFGQPIFLMASCPGYVPERRPIVLRSSSVNETVHFSLRKQPPRMPTIPAPAPRAELIPVYKVVIPGDVILTPFDQELMDLRRRWPGPFNGNSRGHAEQVLGYCYPGQRPGTLHLLRYRGSAGQHLFTTRAARIGSSTRKIPASGCRPVTRKGPQPAWCSRASTRRVENMVHSHRPILSKAMASLPPARASTCSTAQTCPIRTPKVPWLAMNSRTMPTPRQKNALPAKTRRPTRRSALLKRTARPRPGNAHPSRSRRKKNCRPSMRKGRPWPRRWCSRHGYWSTTTGSNMPGTSVSTPLNSAGP
jgi:LSD1 subclass zinc finger protein